MKWKHSCSKYVKLKKNLSSYFLSFFLYIFLCFKLFNNEYLNCILYGVKPMSFKKIWSKIDVVFQQHTIYALKLGILPPSTQMSPNYFFFYYYIVGAWYNSVWIGVWIILHCKTSWSAKQNIRRANGDIGRWPRERSYI